MLTCYCNVRRQKDADEKLPRVFSRSFMKSIVSRLQVRPNCFDTHVPILHRQRPTLRMRLVPRINRMTRQGCKTVCITNLPELEESRHRGLLVMWEELMASDPTST